MNSLPNVITKTFNQEEYKTYIFTVDLKNVETLENVMTIYSNLIDYIKANKLNIVYEKYFGKNSVINELTQRRDDILLNYGITKPPMMYVEGLSIYNTPMSGIHVYAIDIDNQTAIRYIKDDLNKVIGSEISTKKMKALHLFISTKKQETVQREFDELFHDIDKNIVGNGYACTDIIRTWIYLNDIFKDYKVLNDSRREFFKNVGINYSSSSAVLPASTCIQGKGVLDSSNIHTYCIKKSKSNVAISRVYNEFQNEAEGNEYLYRPTFSRGLILNYDACTELQVSGTASINKNGETIYKNDPYKQIEYTLLNIKNILSKANMDFSDLCNVACYFKSPEYYMEFQEIVRKLEIGDFAACYMVADVCRDDLLFELDGIAFKNKTISNT
ncbi:MAG: Rid family hydrolase [Bacillota bacterium]